VPLPPLVLAYHGIGSVPLRREPNGLFVRRDLLAKHIAKLRSWGYVLMTFGDLAEQLAAGEGTGCAALTFDDGFADNISELTELGAPCTLFAVSGWLGGFHAEIPWAPIVSVAELRSLADAGVEIGSHSHMHSDLSTLSYSEARSDFDSSKRLLEEILDRPVDLAAYPYGSASDETIRACRDAGFRAACRNSGQGSWTDPHNIPRQDMNNGSTMIGLRLKRDDLYEPLMERLPFRAIRAATRRAQLLIESLSLL